MKVDKKVGERYLQYACDDCKEKIKIATDKLSKWDMINPIGLSRQFMKLMCSSCKRRLIKQIKKNGL